MQTFLPFPNFRQSAEVLDFRRLGKQRVEVLQILRALESTKKDAGWINHPAVKMWEGYQYALSIYGLECCVAWENRGYNRGTTRDEILWRAKRYSGTGGIPHAKPFWFGDDRFHSAHRRMLVWKMPDHYLVKFVDVPEVPLHKPDYYWPTKSPGMSHLSE